MNNPPSAYQSRCKSSASCFYSLQPLFRRLLILIAAGLMFTAPSSAQTSIWRYVATLPGGVKTYLNESVKSLPNKNQVRWEKIIKADGTWTTALIEWNCAEELRLPRQLTFYNADGSVIGTKKTGFVWTPIIPDSAAAWLFRRVCLPAALVLTARITAPRTALHSAPDQAATVTRFAGRGERFEIVPETGRGNWYNIVDAFTQEDYWLEGDAFEPIRGAIHVANQKLPTPSSPPASRRNRSARRSGGRR